MWNETPEIGRVRFFSLVPQRVKPGPLMRSFTLSGNDKLMCGSRGASLSGTLMNGAVVGCGGRGGAVR